MELFAERGFDGATTGAIASRAGVNKAMISYHFQGKAGLYEAILVNSLDEVSDRLRALGDSGRPADELLRAVLDSFAELHRSRSSLPAMMLREVVSGGRNLTATVLPRFVGLFGIVREIIERGVREGAFRPVDPLFTHLSLLGAVIFFFASAPFRERLLQEGYLDVTEMPTPDRFIAHLKNLFSRGLAAEIGAQEN